MKKTDRMRRARELAEQMGEAAREKAEEILSGAREGAEDLYDHAREGAEAAWDRGSDYVEGGFDELHVFMKRQWRERPVVVAATAVSIGMLVGMALRGGRR